MNQPMPALSPRRRNVALWIGFAILLVSVLTGLPILYPALYAAGIPPAFLPWVSLALPVIGLVFCFVGLKRAFGDPQVFRGKVAGSILTVVSVLFVALSIVGFLFARALPASAHAPQVGQKVADFTLNNDSGQPTSLGALLSTPIDPASGKAPKAVLLVFYRGYW